MLTPSDATQVQLFYSLAILLSVPLQLFPAVRIMENGLFMQSGKADPRVKWQKNIFRFGVVAFCGALSYVGAADLDKFVSFIGSFAWCVHLLPPRSSLRTLTRGAACRCAMCTPRCCTTRRVRARGRRRLRTSR